MPSTDAKIYKALIDHLDVKGYPYDLVEPGGKYDPAPGTPYAMLDDLRFDFTRLYVGSGRNKSRGSLMVTVMTPLNWTYLERIEAAGLFADYFPASTYMTYDDIEILTTKDAQVVNSGYIDGTHFRQTVSCPWEGLV